MGKGQSVMNTNYEAEEPMGRPGMKVSTNLSAWVGQYIGPGKMFNSPRAFSVATGVDEKTIANVIDTGKGSLTTLLKIADTVGASRIDLLVIAGWISPEDIHGPSNPALGNLLRTWYLLPDIWRQEWLESGARLLRTLGMSISESAERN